MESVQKAKAWINENAPMLTKVYQNKYVDMLYDRFASLPPKQQKNVILGTVLGVFSLFLIFLLSAYLTLWSQSSRARQAYSMVGLLMEHQRQRREKSGEIQNLERNNQLSPPGAFKAHLIDQGRSASISPRMIQIEEKQDGGGGDGEDEGPKKDLHSKTATVKLSRVNLDQLKNFIQNLEFGPYNLSISSVRITNDDKIRGYMNVELGVVAYLFQSEES